MIAQVSQIPLSNALKAVCAGISDGNERPIYGGVLIEAVEDAIVLMSCDSIRSILQRISANVEERGKAVVPGALCEKLVKKFPADVVTVRTVGTATEMRCGKSVVSLSSLSPDEFPMFPETSPESCVEVGTQTLRTLAEGVKRCISKEVSNPLFCGIHIEVSNNVISLSSTDGYRVASCSGACGDGEMVATVDGKVFHEALAATTSEVTTIGMCRNTMVMSSGPLTYVCRLIEGRFPDYRMIYPANPSITAWFDASDMGDALDRMSEMSKDSSSVRVDALDEELVITTVSGVKGSMETAVPATLDGEGSFNVSPRFLSECLKALHDEVKVDVGTNTCSIVSDDDVSHVYVVGLMVG